MFMGPGFEKDLFCENIMIKIAFEMDMEVGLECLWALDLKRICFAKT